MHEKRQRRSDVTFRVRCVACEDPVERFAYLGGETRERAENGKLVELRCATCGVSRPHEVVAP